MRAPEVFLFFAEVSVRVPETPERPHNDSTEIVQGLHKDSIESLQRDATKDSIETLQRLYRNSTDAQQRLQRFYRYSPEAFQRNFRGTLQRHYRDSI